MSCSRFAPVTLLQPHSCFQSCLLCFIRPSEGSESTSIIKINKEIKIPWNQFDCLELSHTSHFGEVRERDPTLHLYTWREPARAREREHLEGARSRTPGHVPPPRNRRAAPVRGATAPTSPSEKGKRERRDTPEGEEGEKRREGSQSQKSLKSEAGHTPQPSNRINYAEYFKLRNTFPLTGELCCGQEAAPARYKNCFVLFLWELRRVLGLYIWLVDLTRNANELKRCFPPPHLSQTGQQKYETFEVKSTHDKPLHPAVLPSAAVIPPNTPILLDMRGKVFKNEEEKIPVARSCFVFASTLEPLNWSYCFSLFQAFTISILWRQQSWHAPGMCM